MRLFLLFLFITPSLIAQNLVLQGVNVIPVNSNTVVMACDVFIKGGKIEKIKPAGSLPYAKNYEVMDCKGKYVMPGLADMHTHFPDAESPIKLQEFLKLNFDFKLNNMPKKACLSESQKHLRVL